MPATINGIGTQYYGKKNQDSHSGTCPHCQRNVLLTSYDTRLWFVVVFIPVIPLGRKRIIDECASCRRHYVADADKWDQTRQLEVSGSMEKFRANPTPELANEAHQQMAAFRQFTEAAAFRKVAAAAFPGNAKLQTDFAATLGYYGRLEEALACSQRALELRPDLPEARIGVAQAHIRASRVDQARPLLDFLEKPGAGQLYPLVALENLAYALQRLNRHEEALALFLILQRELPKVGEHPAFRKSVRKSEKALHRGASQLPPLPFGWKRLLGAGADSKMRSLLIGGLILACVAFGLAGSNEYIRRHRTLHLVNVLPTPATVRIDGVGEFSKLRAVQAVEITEGRYHATISGPVQEEFDFEIASDYFSRWGDDPAWVINVGGAAVLIRQESTYSQHPPPARYTFHFGNTFETFGGITHPFTGLPTSIQLKSNESRVLVNLQVHRGTGIDLFEYLTEHGDHETALRFAENWLGTHPQDEAVLKGYLGTILERGLSARGDKIIRPLLATRPVNLALHRSYQDLHRHPEETVRLMAEYTDALAADPANSDLLYLCGRIATGRPAARDYFERAIQADPANPYPLYALAYDVGTLGDWAKATELLARAVELKGDEPMFRDRLIVAQLGLGETAVVEKAMRAQLAGDPLNYNAAGRLIEALALQDRKAEAIKTCETYAQALRGKYGKDANETINSVHLLARYATGDIQAYADYAAKLGLAGRRYLFIANIEQNKPAEAAKVVNFLPATDPSNQLALAILWQLADNPAEVAKAVATVRRLFAQADSDYAPADALLDTNVSFDPAVALDLKIQPREKLLMLVFLALRHPEHRAQLHALARTLNREPVFPYQLVRRLTENPQ